MNKLNVIQDETPATPYSDSLKPKSFRELTKARFERLWKHEPHQFDPMRNARERLRVKRTIAFIRKHLNLSGLRIVDLGSGIGYLARSYRDEGAIVDAVEIAQNAPSVQPEKGINPIISCIPNTHLEDNSYDLVACTELIGHLSPREHRLFFNELARLVKREGKIIFSTSVDIYSDDALERLFSLMSTELEIIDYRLSYHSRQIRLANFFAMPRKFFSASLDSEARKTECEARSSIWRLWFNWNSAPFMGKVWKRVAPLSSWIEKAVNQSDTILRFLEWLRHSEASISHIIILAERKQLFPDTGD